MPTIKDPKAAFPKAKWFDPQALVARIRLGDRVTILVPNGIGRNGQEWKEATGRATICNHLRNPNNLTVVLNMGGPHGTPGVATPENIVCISKNERALHTSTTGTPWHESTEQTKAE